MKVFENNIAPQLEITMQGASVHLEKQYQIFLEKYGNSPTLAQAEKFISERGLVKRKCGNFGKYGAHGSMYTWPLFGVSYA